MPYRDKHCEAAKASKRKHALKYYWANRQECIDKSTRWRSENLDRFNANSRRYRRECLMSKVLLRNAQQRARRSGIEFSITLDDIVCPEFCPVLGLRLAIGDGAARDFSPSVDRIDPKRGYVPGNVCIISHKANTIKSNATVAEMRAVLAYMESHGQADARNFEQKSGKHGAWRLAR